MGLKPSDHVLKAREKVMASILGLTRLRKGWDKHDADPPNMTATFASERIVYMVEDPAVLTAEAIPDGGIKLRFRPNGAKSAYIECHNNGGMIASYFDADASKAWHPHPVYLLRSISDIQKFLGRE